MRASVMSDGHGGWSDGSCRMVIVVCRANTLVCDDEGMGSHPTLAV